MVKAVIMTHSNSPMVSTASIKFFMRKRRMGVEPTRDRAERPPSRFEDGETHRGPYTSICVGVFCHSGRYLSSVVMCVAKVAGCALHLLLSDLLPLIRLCAIPADRDYRRLQCSAFRLRVLPQRQRQHLRLPDIALDAYVAPWQL